MNEALYVVVCLQRIKVLSNSYWLLLSLTPGTKDFLGDDGAVSLQLPLTPALSSAWMRVPLDNLRKRSKVGAGVHVVSWYLCVRLLLGTAGSEEKESCSLGSEVWQWSSVIGFQDNKAVLQISICISAFSACSSISAFSLEKNDGRNFSGVICEKCLLSQGLSVSNNQPLSPSNRWLLACSLTAWVSTLYHAVIGEVQC